MILCCICGIPTLPNERSMCVRCVCKENSGTSAIPLRYTLNRCTKCTRYLHPPNRWVLCEPNSRELLVVLMAKMKKTTRVDILDVDFVHGDEYNKTISLRLTYRHELTRGVYENTACTVTFVIRKQQCGDCSRLETKMSWKSLVQIRQRNVPDKSTFEDLEKQIIERNIHRQCSNIEQRHEGIDFYFQKHNAAVKFTTDLSKIIIFEKKESKHLVSIDTKSNIVNHRHTISVILPHVSRGDLIKIAAELRDATGMSEFVLCTGVSTTIRLYDPLKNRTHALSAANYLGSRKNIEVAATTRHTKRYRVTCSPAERVPEQNGTLVDAIAEKITNISAEHAQDCTVRVVEEGTSFPEYRALSHIEVPADACVSGYRIDTLNADHEEASEYSDTVVVWTIVSETPQ